MALSILYFKLKFLTFYIFLSLKVVFISPNSAEPDHNELLYYAAFHLGLHCLPKDLLLGVQN